MDLSYDDSTGFYTIPAFFGDNQQGGEDSKFLIDTISPFVAITEVDCDNCSDNGGGIFDPATSSTFQYVTDPGDSKQINVGELILSGYWGSDQIEIHTNDGSFAWVPEY